MTWCGRKERKVAAIPYGREDVCSPEGPGFWPFSRFYACGRPDIPAILEHCRERHELRKNNKEANMENTLMAFAAALAVGLSALATGWAQSRIGSAGAGTLAEKPELTATMIIMLAIPETMVILGFVIAAMILLKF